MTINTENVPVKPSQVSVVTSLNGSERVLATRMSGPNSPKTVAVPAYLMGTSAGGGLLKAVNNLSDLSSVTAAVSNLGLGTIALLDQITGNELDDTGVVSGIYGNATNVGRFTVDDNGRIVSAANVPIGPMFASISTADGTATATSSQTVLTVEGKYGVRASAAGQTLTIAHDNSGVSAGIYGTSLIIPVFTVNDAGHVTQVTRVTMPAIQGLQSVFDTVQTSTSTASAVSLHSTLGILGDGTFISTEASVNNIRIFHNNSGVVSGTYGTSLIVPQFTVDAKGHITGVALVTIDSAHNTFGNVSADQGNYTAVSQADVVNVRGGFGIKTSITGNVLTVYNASSGASVGHYGTSTIIPVFDVDGYGNITSISRVTLGPFLANVSTTGGSYAAVSAQDVVNFRGGTGVQMSITSNVITTYLASSGASAGTYGTSTVQQVFTVDGLGRITNIDRVTIGPMFANVSGDAGTYAAVSAADVINVRGGFGLKTSITSNVMTVYNASSGASAGHYGTSTIIPVFDVDGYGNITSVNRVTIGPFLANVSTTGGSYAAVSAQDVVNFRGGTGVQMSITTNVITTYLASSGASAGNYGTSTIGVRFDMDGLGRITSIERVTIGPMFANVSANSGTYAATSAADVFDVRGGFGVLTSITGRVLTVYNASSGASAGNYGTAVLIPRFDVDGYGNITSIGRVTIGPVFGVVSADQGSYTAVSQADIITLRGGFGIKTSITGAIMTVYNASSGASIGNYGTSIVIPRFDVDGYGNITSISRVTLAPYIMAVSASNGGAFTATGYGDTLSFRSDNNVNVSVGAAGVVTWYLTSTGASSGTYGTSLIIPQFTVDGLGRITNITRVTIDGAGIAGGITAITSATDVSTGTVAARNVMPELVWDNVDSKYAAALPGGASKYAFYATDFTEHVGDVSSGVNQILNGNGLVVFNKWSSVNGVNFVFGDPDAMSGANTVPGAGYAGGYAGLCGFQVAQVSSAIALVIGMRVSASAPATLPHQGTNNLNIWQDNNQVIELYSRFAIRTLASAACDYEMFAGFHTMVAGEVSATTAVHVGTKVTNRPFVGLFHSKATTTFQLIRYSTSNAYTTVDTGITVATSTFYNFYLKLQGGTTDSAVSMSARLNGTAIDIGTGLQQGGLVGSGGGLMPTPMRLFMLTSASGATSYGMTFLDYAAVRRSFVSTTRGVW